MRAPTPSPEAVALKAATAFLRSCVAINWFGAANPAGVSFFLPKLRRTKLDDICRKNFAKLFAMARGGDAEADYYLRQELLKEVRLPPAKREALGWLLLHPVTERRRGRGEKRVSNRDRDFIIAQAVLHATAASGLEATRGTGTTTTASGSSVVAEALRQLELLWTAESNVNKIWRAHAKRIRRTLLLPRRP
jgi:hypothetical protein